MYGENVTTEQIETLVDNLSKKFSKINREDTAMIVSTTLDNYFSEQGVKHFFDSCYEKLQIPHVIEFIRSDPHFFFYVESHFQDETIYRMLEDVPLDVLKKEKEYTVYKEPWADY